MITKRTKYYIDVYKDKRREFRWRVRHRNGRIVAEGGEGYRSKATLRHSLTAFLASVSKEDYTWLGL